AHDCIGTPAIGREINREVVFRRRGGGGPIALAGPVHSMLIDLREDAGNPANDNGRDEKRTDADNEGNSTHEPVPFLAMRVTALNILTLSLCNRISTMRGNYAIIRGYPIVCRCSTEHWDVDEAAVVRWYCASPGVGDFDRRVGF